MAEALELPAGIPSAGEVLSEKYEIERMLGRGGMGVVLAARHVTLGQRVAVKMLLPEVAKLPEAAERFLREARASTNLRSEHVARVVDVGTQASGAPYLVMEYLEGRDLHQVATGPVPLGVSDAVEYVLQAAEALAEAHSVGIVHRDLKPANLFLATRADGSPLIKVLDFGISKATMPGERGITATEAVLGSPGYMSPEQIRSAKYVDQRADVWGVGVCLYELLTGQPPFDGSSVAAVSVQIVLETPKPVHELRPDVPEELSRVVQRCLEKEPAKRYANMGELAAALLPFAPSTAAPLADSIRRIARGSVPFAATVAASTPDLQSAVAGGTDGNWERTKQRPQRGRTLMLALAGFGLVAALLASVFALGRRSVETATPAASETGRAVAASAAEQPPAQLEPRSEPSATSAAPPPASTVAPDVAAPAGSVHRARPSSVPRAPVCPKGQVLSAGHCCPSGLVWQKTACDRPLAVSLP